MDYRSKKKGFQNPGGFRNEGVLRRQNPRSLQLEPENPSAVSQSDIKGIVSVCFSPSFVSEVRWRSPPPPFPHCWIAHSICLFAYSIISLFVSCNLASSGTYSSTLSFFAYIPYRNLSPLLHVAPPPSPLPLLTFSPSSLTQPPFSVNLPPVSLSSSSPPLCIQSMHLSSADDTTPDECQ